MNTFRTLLCCSTLALAACGGETNNTPADAATPTDGASADTVTPPADGGGGMCYREMGTAPLCPMRRAAQANPMQPSFRLTHITITAPAALASPLLGSVVNGAIHSGGFLWGITFDLSANMLRTGAFNTMFTRGTNGQGLLDGAFSYYTGNAPAMGGAATRWDPVSTGIMVAGNNITATAVMGTVRLPIFSGGALLTELPLVNANLSASLSMDRGCIGLGEVAGGSFDECTANWNTMNAGTLSAVITAADARTVRVESLMTTLCNLLAGSNCEATPMMMWTRQPDTMVNGMPGYTLTARYAGVSATIR